MAMQQNDSHSFTYYLADSAMKKQKIPESERKGVLECMERVLGDFSPTPLPTQCCDNAAVPKEECLLRRYKGAPNLVHAQFENSERKQQLKGCNMGEQSPLALLLFVQPVITKGSRASNGASYKLEMVSQLEANARSLDPRRWMESFDRDSSFHCPRSDTIKGIDDVKSIIADFRGSQLEFMAVSRQPFQSSQPEAIVVKSAMMDREIIGGEGKMSDKFCTTAELESLVRIFLPNLCEKKSDKYSYDLVTVWSWIHDVLIYDFCIDTVKGWIKLFVFLRERHKASTSSTSIPDPKSWPELFLGTIFIFQDLTQIRAVLIDCLHRCVFLMHTLINTKPSVQDDKCGLDKLLSLSFRDLKEVETILKAIAEKSSTKILLQNDSRGNNSQIEETNASTVKECKERSMNALRRATKAATLSFFDFAEQVARRLQPANLSAEELVTVKDWIENNDEASIVELVKKKFTAELADKPGVYSKVDEDVKTCFENCECPATFPKINPASSHVNTALRKNPAVQNLYALSSLTITGKLDLFLSVAQLGGKPLKDSVSIISPKAERVGGPLSRGLSERLLTPSYRLGEALSLALSQPAKKKIEMTLYKHQQMGEVLQVYQTFGSDVVLPEQDVFGCNEFLKQEGAEQDGNILYTFGVIITLLNNKILVVEVSKKKPGDYQTRYTLNDGPDTMKKISLVDLVRHLISRGEDRNDALRDKIKKALTKDKEGTPLGLLDVWATAKRGSKKKDDVADQSSLPSGSTANNTAVEHAPVQATTNNPSQLSAAGSSVQESLQGTGPRAEQDLPGCTARQAEGADNCCGTPVDASKEGDNDDDDDVTMKEAQNGNESSKHKIGSRERRRLPLQGKNDVPEVSRKHNRVNKGAGKDSSKDSVTSTESQQSITATEQKNIGTSAQQIEIRASENGKQKSVTSGKRPAPCDPDTKAQTRKTMRRFSAISVISSKDSVTSTESEDSAATDDQHIKTSDCPTFESSATSQSEDSRNPTKDHIDTVTVAAGQGTTETLLPGERAMLFDLYNSWKDEAKKHGKDKIIVEKTKAKAAIVSFLTTSKGKHSRLHILEGLHKLVPEPVLKLCLNEMSHEKAIRVHATPESEIKNPCETRESFYELEPGPSDSNLIQVDSIT